MTRDTIIKALSIGAMVVAVGVIAFNSYMGSQAHADAPNGTAWACTNPDCGHGFTKTITELAEFYDAHPGADMPCPECGGTAVRAFHCVECDKLFAPSKRRSPPICPICGKDVRSQQSE